LSPPAGFATVARERVEARIWSFNCNRRLTRVERLEVTEMSESYLLIVLTFGVWLACFIQSHRLFYKFRAKHPDIAQRDIPRAFETCEDPGKLFYFLRRKSLEVLRSDPELWGLRQQVKVLTILSVIVPPVGFAFLVRAAILVLARE
jgi:hypothetical protein